MKDYLKVVIANKATLASYTVMLGAGVGIAVGANVKNEALHDNLLNWGIYAAGLGFVTGIFTEFGLGTLRTYVRTREHIQRHGSLAPHYPVKYKLYCDQVGIRLATREAGLEHILNENI